MLALVQASAFVACEHMDEYERGPRVELSSMQRSQPSHHVSKTETETDAQAYYSSGQLLGRGTYGSVHRGTHRLTQRTVALKKVSASWHCPAAACDLHS